MTSHRIGKYACLELERRYLLERIPGNLVENSDGWSIKDRYLTNTRLRLRRMASLSGKEIIYKLTQKYRAEAQSAFETTITNIYLTEAEYKRLEPIEALVIKKRRYPYSSQNHNFSIDVFEGRHQGLILAEIEFESKSDADRFALPSFAYKDVTDDSFFTGGNLAVITDEEFRRGLLERLRDHKG